MLHKSENTVMLPDEIRYYLASRLPENVEIAVILGSGLGHFADTLEIIETIPTSEIPGYPKSTIEGHEGSILLCNHNGKSILLFKGRLHSYEGYSAIDVALPASIAASFGAHTLIVTNAAGGINPGFSVGDFMLVTDYLVLPIAMRMGFPLNALLTKSPGMKHAPVISDELILLTRSAALATNTQLREGTYGYCSGPAYETRAEICFLRKIGVDAVGMSTVPEIIVARQNNIDVIGISCITNKAQTVRNILTHEDVTKAASQVSVRFSRLLLSIIERL